MYIGYVLASQLESLLLFCLSPYLHLVAEVLLEELGADILEGECFNCNK